MPTSSLNKNKGCPTSGGALQKVFEYTDRKHYIDKKI
jgi:hypothetical protein